MDYLFIYEFFTCSLLVKNFSERLSEGAKFLFNKGEKARVELLFRNVSIKTV